MFNVALNPAKLTDKTTPLLDIIDKVYHCLHSMMDHLRSFFDNSVRRIAFLSIHSNSLTSDLYFGHEDLHNTEISNKMMQSFFALLMSHQELSLEDGFQIRICLLSVDHVQHQLGKIKAVAKRNAVYLKDYYDKPFGARSAKRNQSVVPKRKYYRIEAGTVVSPDCFANSCLLIALTVGDLFHKAYEKHEDGNHILKHLKALQCKKNKTKQEEAAFFVIQHAYKLIKGVKGLKLVGPHTLRQLEPLCKKHKIQLCIYSKAFGNKMVAQIPKGPLLTFKKVHLYEDTLLEDTVLNHVDLLLEAPSTVDGKFYTPCCSALVHRKDVKCPHMLQCLECRRPMVKPHHYYSHLMKHVCTKLRNDIKAHKLTEPKVCSGCFRQVHVRTTLLICYCLNLTQ